MNWTNNTLTEENLLNYLVDMKDAISNTKPGTVQTRSWQLIQSDLKNFPEMKHLGTLWKTSEQVFKMEILKAFRSLFKTDTLQNSWLNARWLNLLREIYVKDTAYRGIIDALLSNMIKYLKTQKLGYRDIGGTMVTGIWSTATLAAGGAVGVGAAVVMVAAATKTGEEWLSEFKIMIGINENIKTLKMSIKGL